MTEIDRDGYLIQLLLELSEVRGFMSEEDPQLLLDELTKIVGTISRWSHEEIQAAPWAGNQVAGISLTQFWFPKSDDNGFITVECRECSDTRLDYLIGRSKFPKELLALAAVHVCPMGNREQEQETEQGE